MQFMRCNQLFTAVYNNNNGRAPSHQLKAGLWRCVNFFRPQSSFRILTKSDELFRRPWELLVSPLSGKVRPCKIATNTFATLSETWRTLQPTQSMCAAFLEAPRGWNNKSAAKARGLLFDIYSHQYLHAIINSPKAINNCSLEDENSTVQSTPCGHFVKGPAVTEQQFSAKLPPAPLPPVQGSPGARWHHRFCSETDLE